MQLTLRILHLHTRAIRLSLGRRRHHRLPHRRLLREPHRQVSLRVGIESRNLVFMLLRRLDTLGLEPRHLELSLRYCTIMFYTAVLRSCPVFYTF